MSLRSTQVLVFMVWLTATAAPLLGGYATEVISFYQGTGLDESDAAFGDPQTALGAPARMTGPAADWPSRLSVYSPACTTDQVVSLGTGGSLTVRFEQPIVDDPAHPYGVDLIVFGNAAFTLANFPELRTGNPVSLLGAGQGQIEVSADGVNFYLIPGAWADQLFPLQGYLDGGPFDSTPGNVPTDHFKPVNPALGLADFNSKTYQEILALYDGSGGGLPVDLASAVDALGQPAGLTTASYVRVSHAGGEDTTIDAFVAVPEPASLTLFAAMLVAVFARKPAHLEESM